MLFIKFVLVINTSYDNFADTERYTEKTTCNLDTIISINSLAYSIYLTVMPMTFFNTKLGYHQQFCSLFKLNIRQEGFPLCHYSFNTIRKRAPQSVKGMQNHLEILPSH